MIQICESSNLFQIWKWLKLQTDYNCGVGDSLREFFAQMHKTALVSCVEVTLMHISNTRYHKTVAKLRAYDTTISESYSHAEYLKIVLKEVYGNDYSKIINDIKMCLDDLVNEEDIAEFFGVLES